MEIQPEEDHGWREGCFWCSKHAEQIEALDEAEGLPQAKSYALEHLTPVSGIWLCSLCLEAYKQQTTRIEEELQA